jgi:adenine-specific DNA-methyltransferase
MDKLDPKIHGQSPDFVVENVELLRRLFPDIFTEGKVDFDALRQLLGDYADDQSERYGLNWAGKARARQLAQNPSSGTLRPAPDESVDWAITQNVFIEGDNLEVLKLLQKSYHRRVKIIYIDPPYNTGQDFIYSDKYQDSLNTYLRYTGQMDGDGLKITANIETHGRYHTNWLNMMYPRLKLARNLLRDDGIIFVSIADHEVHNLRHLMDEVFGPENFVGTLIWKSRVSEDTRAKTGLSNDHEYILCFRRSDEGRLRGTGKDIAKFSNPDSDPRGPWRSADLTGLAPRDRRPNLHYDLIDPASSINYGCPPMGWRYNRNTMAAKIAEGRILWPSSPDGRPRHKLFLEEMKNAFKNTSSILLQTSTSDGTREVNELIGNGIFSFPKPTALIRFLIEQTSDGETASSDIVLDFFAGSGSTGDAVMQLNAQDDGKRRFVLVQLPVPSESSDYASIAEITKARLRAAAKAIAEESAGSQLGLNQSGDVDLGFRVFKLDSTNIKPWDGDFDNLESNLLAAVDNIKHGRSEDDVLYELLLKYGLDLSLPIESRTVDGKRLFLLGAGALVVCLASEVTLNVVEEIGALKKELNPEVMRVVFRDASFKDDVVKTNAMQILKRAGIDDIKSL